MKSTKNNNYNNTKKIFHCLEKTKHVERLSIRNSGMCRTKQSSFFRNPCTNKKTSFDNTEPKIRNSSTHVLTTDEINLLGQNFCLAKKKKNNKSKKKSLNNLNANSTDTNI